MISSPPSLKLDYGFVSTPNPIRASATGANPNTIDLQIVVSNPSLSSVTMSQVQITIPVGEDTSRALSTSPSLPPPTYDTSGPWKITSVGSTVTIVPRSGTSQAVTAPIIFTLPAIQVNHQPGTVPLTITEFPPLQPTKVVDSTTYSLFKQEADFPVTSFYADPASLDDLDQPVTLYWTVSDQGKQDVYGLRLVSVGRAVAALDTELRSDSSGPAAAAPPQLKNCVSDGDCYTWEDGQNGVLVSSVSQTTTFALDVVSATGSHRSVVGTLQTTVEVTVPWISQNSYVKPSPSGRLVWVHWLAFNARSCTVQLDGVVIDANAPPDTYRSGYLITLTGNPSPHQISVIAHALSGNAQASFPFPTVTIRTPATIPGGEFPQAIAFTPDGTLALVNNEGESSVTVIDVATLTPESQKIPVGKTPAAIAITPDGSLAFTADLYSDTVTVIDIATRTPEAKKISISQPNSLAVTPDGSSLLVVDQLNNRVVVVDIGTRTPQATSIPTAGLPLSIAVTPDGKLAFTANIQNDTSSVIDIASRQVKATVKVGHGAYGVAVTPDGSLALVMNNFENSVSFIDVASLKVVATVATDAGPVSAAVTPDSSRALVANIDGASVTIVDIAARTGATIPGGNKTSGVGIATDGSLALIANGGGNYVAVM